MLNQEWKTYLNTCVNNQTVNLNFDENSPTSQPNWQALKNFLAQYSSNEIGIAGDDLEKTLCGALISTGLEVLMSDKTKLVNIKQCNLEAVDFSFFKKCKNLNFLALTQTKLNDNQLELLMAYLKGCPYLAYLDLTDNHIENLGSLYVIKEQLAAHAFIVDVYMDGNPCLAKDETLEKSGIKPILEENRKKLTKKFKKEIKDKQNNDKVIRFLNEYGLLIKGKHGETALHWAAFHGNHPLASRLCQLDLDVNVADLHNKRVPLMWAALRLLYDNERYVKTIKVLIKHGAKLDARDHKGRNIHDVLSVVNHLLADEQIHRYFKREGDTSMYSPFELAVKTPAIKTSVALDGDDSSDEEMSEYLAKGYDVTSQLSDFKTGHAYEALSESLGFNVNVESSATEEMKKTNAKKQKIAHALYVTHSKGQQYLFAKPVNTLYYQTNAKYSLGRNRFGNDDGKLKQWVTAAYLQTVADVFFDGNREDKGLKDLAICIAPTKEMSTNDAIRGLLHNPVIEAVMENKRQFFRQYKMLTTALDFFSRCAHYIH